KVVEESAALALGIMQDRSPAVRKFLSEIASDTDAKIRTRCFSMYALGLLGEPDAAAGSGVEVLDVLKSLVAAKESSTDIANSALIAIGLLGDPAATPDLLQWLREEKAGTNKLSDLSLSYVAGALGKIDQPGLSGPDSREVVDALRDQLKRKNRKTRYSTVIALGQVAPQANAKIQMDCVKILSQVVKGEGKRSDTQTVNYGLAALGRIAGVEAAEDGSGGTPAAVRDKAIETLLRAFDSNKTGTRNFAALGLGIAARVQDAQIRMPIQERIRNTLARTSGDVEKRGAMIISLGMLKDRQAAPLLQKLLEDRGLQKELRGTAAVALGLMGERKALPAIRAALAEKQDRKLRVDAGIAAGLLKDNTAVPSLIEILQDPKSSQFILGSVAMALGQIGDERAVEPMGKILRDEEYPDLTRALAAVALGQVGDKTDLPVLSRVSRDINYRAYYDAIGELLTII
ncbi:MAG: HEAT repeat domain-containing protein, partial [Planctomycetota bacterium]